MNKYAWLATLSLALTGCTVVNKATLPSQASSGDVFITQESIPGPYKSLGLMQITRRGALLFGWGDVVGTDLEEAIAQAKPKIRERGADGMINMRVQQTQYTTPARIFGAIFFFAPLPAEVTITGELVQLEDGPDKPAAPKAEDE